MISLRRLRSLWIPWLTTFVLAGFGTAFAQTSYQVTDLGTEGNNNMACAMSVNNEGWTEIMAGTLSPAQVDSILGTLLSGRALIDVDGFKADLGSLGGQNTWMNWGEINDYGQIVGESETSVPDPNGEDICGFGTHLTCRPFLWQLFRMRALPTLGGNNGEASAINDRGQIAGMAENGNVDPTCPPDTTNNRIQLPVLWENGRPRALPTVDGDPDGFAFWLNEHGEVAGYTGTCGTAIIHAVSWKNGNASQLPDLGTGAVAYSINDQGQIVGTIGSSDGSTQYASLWQNGVLTNLGTLPGDAAAIASGINNQGQVVGSTWDSSLNWSHGFIYQNGVMTDLNTLFPAGSNLYAVMANKVNDRGQVSGMAIVLSGPDMGNIHAFLATPVNGPTGRSIADAVPARPHSNSPAKVGDQFSRRFLIGRSGR